MYSFEIVKLPSSRTFERRSFSNYILKKNMLEKILVVALFATNVCAERLKVQSPDGATVQIDPWGNNAVRVREYYYVIMCLCKLTHYVLQCTPQTAQTAHPLPVRHASRIDGMAV